MRAAAFRWLVIAATVYSAIFIMGRAEAHKPTPCPTATPTPTATSTPTSTPSPTPSPTPTPAPTVTWGFYTQGYPESEQPMHDLESITARAEVVHWYVQWAGWNKGGEPGYVAWSSVEAEIQRAHFQGRVPFITWEAWGTPGANPTGADDFPLQNIAAGQYDWLIDDWARGAAAQPGPIYLRVFHEPNFWACIYPWSVQQGCLHTPSQYVAAWRHIVDRFRLAGAWNVSWILNPGGDLVNNPFQTSAYPGDAYVDFVGWDAYNVGTQATDYQFMCNIKCTKPWLLGEVSGNTSWVDNELAPLARQHNMIVVWFNEGSFSVQNKGSAAAIRRMLAP